LSQRAADRGLVGTLLLHVGAGALIWVVAMPRPVATSVRGFTDAARRRPDLVLIEVLGSPAAVDLTLRPGLAPTPAMPVRILSDELPTTLAAIPETPSPEAPQSLLAARRLELLACRRAYPDADTLKRDLANVNLHAPLPTDANARTALRCLQAFGTLGPMG
jgi:hypothetical protein